MYTYTVYVRAHTHTPACMMDQSYLGLELGESDLQFVAAVLAEVTRAVEALLGRRVCVLAKLGDLLNEGGEKL